MRTTPEKEPFRADELVMLFAAMRNAKSFTYENNLTVKLLLLLAVRKQELMTARWTEFDLEQAIWRLPAERTKTGAAIDISLSTSAIKCLRELRRLSEGSEWVPPARKAQQRMLPHILADLRDPFIPIPPQSTAADVAAYPREHLECCSGEGEITDAGHGAFLYP